MCSRSLGLGDWINECIHVFSSKESLAEQQRLVRAEIDDDLKARQKRVVSLGARVEQAKQDIVNAKVAVVQRHRAECAKFRKEFDAAKIKPNATELDEIANHTRQLNLRWAQLKNERRQVNAIQARVYLGDSREDCQRSNQLMLQYLQLAARLGAKPEKQKALLDEIKRLEGNLVDGQHEINELEMEADFQRDLHLEGAVGDEFQEQARLEHLERALASSESSGGTGEQELWQQDYQDLAQGMNEIGHTALTISKPAYAAGDDWSELTQENNI